MRFGEIYYKCKRKYDYLRHQKAEIEIYTNDNAAQAISRYFEGADRIFKPLRGVIATSLADIKCLEKSVDEIYACSPIQNSTSLYDAMEKLNILLGKMECIIQLYESMGQLNEENLGLEIKIPATKSITEYKKYVDNLEFIITKCPFFQSNEASINFNTIDVGSMWLILGITCVSVTAGSLLLNNIAAFIDKCFVIRSHKITCERQEQEIALSQMEQKEKDELIKSINKLYKIAIKNAVKELEENSGCHLQNGEEQGMAEQSLEKLEQLIDKGLQIYSSISANNEVKALFAPLEMKYISIEKEIKQLEEKQ